MHKRGVLIFTLFVGSLLFIAGPVSAKSPRVARTHCGRHVLRLRVRCHPYAPPRSVPVAVQGPAAGCANADLIPTSSNLDSVAAAANCLVNRERLRRGLPALGRSFALARIARAHSLDMVARGYFDHVTPGGADPEARVRLGGFVPVGYGYSVGENIAYGTGSLASAAQVVAGWMLSPEHRANILERAYRLTGIGVAYGAPGITDAAATFTQDFGALLAP